MHRVSKVLLAMLQHVPRRFYMCKNNLHKDLNDSSLFFFVNKYTQNHLTTLSHILSGISRLVREKLILINYSFVFISALSHCEILVVCLLWCLWTIALLAFWCLTKHLSKAENPLTLYSWLVSFIRKVCTVLLSISRLDVFY